VRIEEGAGVFRNRISGKEGGVRAKKEMRGGKGEGGV